MNDQAFCLCRRRRSSGNLSCGKEKKIPL